MLLFRKLTLILSILCCAISCRDAIGDQPNTSPKKSNSSDTESREIEKSIDKTGRPIPVKTPINKEVKKKKIKARDTLKPIAVIP